MKVGILTTHCSTNAGACLQAYALYRTVSEIGHKPCIINYRPRYFMEFADPDYHYRTIHDVLKYIIIGGRIKKNYRKYENFWQLYYSNSTPIYRDKTALLSCEKMDTYICGSDQIWNPVHTHYDDSYFLSFVKDSSARLSSYAASIGEDKLDVKDTEYITENIKHLNSISVREDTAVELLRSCGFVANQHIDPSLLITAEQWRLISKKPAKRLPRKFIYYYPLQSTPLESRLIEVLKKDTGLPCVASENGLRKTRGVDYRVTTCSPEEFLWLIDNASIVVTNSFHGSVFSLLFKTRLIPFSNIKRNSRLESLFRLFGLDGLLVNSLEDYQSKKWEQLWQEERNTDEVIIKERARAIEYIKKICC